MANILEMDLRNFSNLDNRKSSCSALTLTLFLIYCTEPTEFLAELKQGYEESAYNNFANDSISYRTKLPIKEKILYENQNSIYAVCPRCKGTVDRDYVKYCTICGQRISWANWGKTSIVKT